MPENSEIPNPPEKYPFSKLSWRLDPKNNYVTIYDDDYKWRRQIVYYPGSGKGSKIPIGQSFQVYKDLQETNFPTLYSLICVPDDFAESFATYVHTVILKRPYEIRLFEKNNVKCKISTLGAG